MHCNKILDTYEPPDSVCIMQHYDGYPKGVAEILFYTLEFVWEFPRFEASDFASGLCTAIKTVYLRKELEQYRKGIKPALKWNKDYKNIICGNARILPLNTNEDDFEYVYTVYSDNGTIYVHLTSREHDVKLPYLKFIETYI